MIELMVVLAVISIIFLLAGIYILRAKKHAYKVISKYDLTQFARIEEEHYVENEVFIGRSGQSIRNDGVDSNFSLSGFYPTDGVCITIISGNPEDPFNADHPFVAQAKHNDASSFFEFNFTTREMVEK